MVDPRIMLITHFLLELWNRILEIVYSPLQVKEMLFILTPLIIVLLVIELYFGRYKYEKLGWNTAVGNSLALVFVGMNLLNFLYVNGDIFGRDAKTLLAFIVCIEALFLLFVNFFHIFPREAAFGISSPLILNFIGIASIIMVYSDIPFDYITLIAFIIIFLIIAIVLSILQSLEAPAIPKVRVGREKLPVPEESA
ncbi:MAG: hypothetical protein KJ767_03445 [Nanoarchaeota archaeon]|nr:hypothetical protein [Nanoarchaeota archaeon]